MSSSAQIVPLDNSPNQTFNLVIAIDGTTKTLRLNLRYNEIADYWVMTVSDIAGNVLVDSVACVTGNITAGNILGQFEYLSIGSAYLINSSGVSSPDFPDNTDLGSDFQLLWDNTP
jgi:Domain of unknown function (DUF6983)